MNDDTVLDATSYFFKNDFCYYTVPIGNISVLMLTIVIIEVAIVGIFVWLTFREIFIVSWYADRKIC